MKTYGRYAIEVLLIVSFWCVVGWRIAHAQSSALATVQEQTASNSTAISDLKTQESITEGQQDDIWKAVGTLTKKVDDTSDLLHTMDGEWMASTGLLTTLLVFLGGMLHFKIEAIKK